MRGAGEKKEIRRRLVIYDDWWRYYLFIYLFTTIINFMTTYK
jgi:hypothetical protein